MSAILPPDEDWPELPEKRIYNTDPRDPDCDVDFAEEDDTLEPIPNKD